MSKSLGNFVTIRELLQDWPGEVLRFNMLRTHYRQPIDWTVQGMKESWKYSGTLVWQIIGHARRPAPDACLFFEALCDDLNTPLAFAGNASVRCRRTGGVASFVGFFNGEKIMPAFAGADNTVAWVADGSASATGCAQGKGVCREATASATNFSRKASTSRTVPTARRVGDQAMSAPALPPPRCGRENHERLDVSFPKGAHPMNRAIPWPARLIFDTTLRDGAQTQGRRFLGGGQAPDRARARCAGHRLYRGRLARRQSHRHGVLCRSARRSRPREMTAFGMTKRAGRSAANDPGLAAVLDAKPMRSASSARPGISRSMSR